MNPNEVIAYYTREDVQQAILAVAKGREVAGMFSSGSFSSRPNTLIYPQDIISQVRSGVVEFHTSLEHWDNPITLQERTGFDLLLDLDCKRFEHGKLAAGVLGDILKEFDVHPDMKFTGNRGFHMGIPWKSIPKDVDFRPTAAQYPGIARKVGLFLRSRMRRPLQEVLLRKWTPEQLAAQIDITPEKLCKGREIDPFAVVDIDTVLLSPRHLFRMPYSLNKKTFLVSVPVTLDELDSFLQEHARPEKIKANRPFLAGGKEGEADILFTEALDWWTRHHKEQKPSTSTRVVKSKISEEMFPPCIKVIGNGLKDGKKRSVFVLINFLRSLKWGWNDIEAWLKEWNARNTPPLPESYIVNGVRYYRNRKSYPPPNCTQEGYYTGIGVCSPDSVCVSRESIKNPVNYPFRVMYKKNRKNRPKRRSRKSI